MLKLGMVSSFHPHSMCERVERVTAKTGRTSCTNWKQKKRNNAKKKKNYTKKLLKNKQKKINNAEKKKTI